MCLNVRNNVSMCVMCHMTVVSLYLPQPIRLDRGYIERNSLPSLFKEVSVRYSIPMADEETSLLGVGKRGSMLDKAAEVEGTLKAYYSKWMRIIRAREFLAEFLATFLLVVRKI